MSAEVYHCECGECSKEIEYDPLSVAYYAHPTGHYILCAECENRRNLKTIKDEK